MRSAQRLPAKCPLAAGIQSCHFRSFVHQACPALLHSLSMQEKKAASTYIKRWQPLSWK